MSDGVSRPFRRTSAASAIAEPAVKPGAFSGYAARTLSRCGAPATFHRVEHTRRSERQDKPLKAYGQAARDGAVSTAEASVQRIIWKVPSRFSTMAVQLSTQSPQFMYR